jgi:hypothetical protein
MKSSGLNLAFEIYLELIIDALKIIWDLFFGICYLRSANSKPPCIYWDTTLEAHQLKLHW